MPRCCKRAAAVGALVLAVLSCASGADAARVRPAVATPQPTSPPNDADRATLVTLVMNAMTQVKLCAYALEKTSNAEVRSLCTIASADSARTAVAGMQLAQTIGATGAKLAPSPDTPAKLDALAKFSGRDFDREFLLAQIENAEGEQDTLRYEVEVTTDESVKQYETTVLPKIERHLKLAETALLGVSEAAP